MCSHFYIQMILQILKCIQRTVFLPIWCFPYMIWCFHTFNMAIKLKRWYCYRIHFKCIERIVKMRKEYKTMMQKSLSFLYSKLILYEYWQKKRVGSRTWSTYFLQVCLKDSNNGLGFFLFYSFYFLINISR